MSDDPKRPDPPEPRVEAMCYSMAPMPTTDEYRCPICGALTEYPLGKLEVLRELGNALPSVAGWTLSLDARAFCRACTPAAAGPVSIAPAPEATLVAKKDGAETRTPGVTLEDLQALRAYAARSLVARLRPTPRRVKELLGMGGDMADRKKHRRERSEGPPEAPPPSVEPSESESQPSAMCYEMAAEPDTDDYLCPACGSRTQHPLESLERLRELEGRMPQVPGWELSLDARELCRSCTPEEPADPAVVLVAKARGKEARMRHVSMDDLEALRRYAETKKPSKRVKKLLGL